MPNWEFLPNQGDEEEGLGHAGIETFKGSPYPGIARECSQNSLDAAAEGPDGNPRPVHLVFRHLDIPASEIPGLLSLKETLRACLKQANARNLKKDKQFFERAIAVVNGGTLPVLSIEDYGTTGLLGPAEPGNPFYALVKSSGVSQKPNADAGGSFGIGKNAAFAISSLRTVFYSTIFTKGKKPNHLTQGKSVLVSHKAAGDGAKRATGYWGSKGYMPVEGDDLIPLWLRRSAIGTTVASVGFIEEPNWHWQMVESLIRNFFAAIDKGTIRFTVIGSDSTPIEIDGNGLLDLFNYSEVRSAAETSGTAEDLDFSAAMLMAMRAPEAQIEEEDFKDVGRVRIRLLQQEGFPKRIGILRNGMYITDNLKHFGHSLARFNLSRDFVAVVEPSDRDTSGRIRDMESPRHDEISADRIDDLHERKHLKAAMKKLGAWIRDLIKRETTKPADAEILLDEMNQFFSNRNDTPSIPDPENKNDDPERVKLHIRGMPSKPSHGNGPDGESGSSGGEKQRGSRTGRTSGDRSGKGRGMNGGRGGRLIQFSELRNSIHPNTHGITRNISFTPNASGSAKLELWAVGVSSDEPLGIKSIDGKPCAKTPLIDLVDGSRTHLRLEFESAYSGPIGLALAQTEEKADEN